MACDVSGLAIEGIQAETMTFRVLWRFCGEWVRLKHFDESMQVYKPKKRSCKCRLFLAIIGSGHDETDTAAIAENRMHINPSHFWLLSRLGQVLNSFCDVRTPWCSALPVFGGIIIWQAQNLILVCDYGVI